MQLSQLIKDISYTRIIGSPTCDIQRICFDSRQANEGCLFVALYGTQADGHRFIEQAVQQGAIAVVFQKGLFQPQDEPTNVVYIETEDSHQALGALASCFYGHPSHHLKLVGVTGTNGKTTTATLLFRLFRRLGYSCGLLSTIANYIDDQELPTSHTTPDSLEINSLLGQMCAHGCSYCFMECSSHAISQGRVSHLEYAGCLFSNLTHDHLDYHKTFAEYLKAKKRLFDELPSSAFALTNIDDKNGLIMVQNTAARVVTYACKSLADYNARILEHSVDGMLLRIDGAEMYSTLIGAHNAYNLLAVYACARLLGADKDECLTALSALKTVAGRLEYVRGGDNLTAVVDYSHTPDALENALKTLREILNPGQQLVCVVGCGGNRDKTKRPIMAQIAHQYADVCIFTSDNPRFEDPDAILADMMAGLTPEEQNKHLCITNRKEAIKTAVRTAKPGSIILVAGKGHENYQDVQGVKHHFDDKEILTNLLK